MLRSAGLFCVILQSFAYLCVNHTLHKIKGETLSTHHQNEDCYFNPKIELSLSEILYMAICVYIHKK